MPLDTMNEGTPLATKDFHEIGKLADNTYSNGLPVAQLYLMAVGTLMSTPGNTHKTPEDIHGEMLAKAQQIYNPHPLDVYYAAQDEAMEVPHVEG